ncbi:MAG: BON domain-containing protein [Planctomycetaceae bacterium]|nr:BON domain-containing protein [Planctomycetaceae bacterium]
MRLWTSIGWTMLLSCVCLSSIAEAQQQRTFGRPLQRQAGPQRLSDVAAEAETAGGITGTERFLRDRRRAGTFVGSDQATTRFVGSGAVIESGRVQSAVESLPPTVDLAAQINRRMPPVGPSQPYAPRLILDFAPLDATEDRTSVETRQHAEQTQVELAQLLSKTGAESLQVEIRDRVAYLTGTVATSRQRELAILLASMQPGVSRVVDQIEMTATAR